MQIPFNFSRYLSAFISVNYYKSLRSQKLMSSFLIFLVGMTLISLVWSSRIVLRELPTLESMALDSVAEIVEHYPQDLVINWDQESLTVTPDQVWEFSYPTPLFESAQNAGFPPQFLKYQPLLDNEEIVIDQKFLIIANSKEAQIQDLAGGWNQFEWQITPGFEESFEIDAQNIKTHASTASTEISESKNHVIPLVFIFAPVWLVLVTLLGGMFDFLISYFLLIKLPGARVTLKHYLAISLHVLVLSQLINQSALWIYGQIGIPLLTISYWAIMFYITLGFRQKAIKL